MKLELKHIAPYLPYGLKVYYFDGEREIQQILSFSSIALGNDPRDEAVLVNGEYEYYLEIQNIQPILRPLSDINIDYTGESISDISDKCDNHCDAYDEWVDSFVDNPCKERLLQAPYEVFEELLKRHFDVFGLIEQGLAIDSNTI